MSANQFAGRVPDLKLRKNDAEWFPRWIFRFSSHQQQSRDRLPTPKLGRGDKTNLRPSAESAGKLVFLFSQTRKREEKPRMDINSRMMETKKARENTKTPPDKPRIRPANGTNDAAND